MTSTAQPPGHRNNTQLPGEAWTRVYIETPNILEMPAGDNRASIEVTVINNSVETLDPNGECTLSLSFRLLSPEGRDVRCECTSTPLSAKIAPGSRHRQQLEVIIPGECNELVGAIRVGMVVGEGFWVGRVNRYHPGTVLLDRGEGMAASQRILLEGAQIWPLGRSNGLTWPHGTMMVSEKHKILYIPVAKCACTSLKSEMIALAGVEHYEKAIEMGVHLITDRFNTGAQLKDKSMKQAWEILASDQYFKFAVIREPFERLVSAYLEKFVYNRHNPRNLLHTRAIIQKVQDTDSIDLERGISFDEFVTVLTGEDPMQLDPHWRPQYLYLEKVKHISKLFRLEHIDKLESCLSQITGKPVHLGHRNRTRRSSELLNGVSVMPANEVQTLGTFDHASFANSKMRDAIDDYYREDLELYRLSE